MKNNKKGFTLIELLVVVSIIGLLASIVLTSLSTARAKGVDAAAKEDLVNAVGQGEIYYNANNNSYVNVCNANNGIKGMILHAASIENAFGYYGSDVAGECTSSSTAWAASIHLKNGVGQYFCVDSNGTKIQTAWTPLYGGITACSHTPPPTS